MSLRLRARPILAALLFVTGCAQQPVGPDGSTQVPEPALQPSQEQALAGEAAMHAMAQVGSPYRYGGTSPAGFDCSGLVRYSYGLAGLDLPRETREQRKLAAPIDREAELRPGDLLFFRRGRNGTLHVGLYVGHGEFVHAPSSGGQVRVERFDAPHWKKRFIEARRIAPAT